MIRRILILTLVLLSMTRLKAESWTWRTSLGYSLPLLDNHRIWKPGGVSNLNSQEYYFDSALGLSLNEGMTWWRKTEDSGFNKSQSNLFKIPVYVSIMLPLTEAGLFEGLNNQLFAYAGAGAEIRLLRWSVDWGYDTYVEYDWNVYPMGAAGLKFEYRGDGGGYFVCTGLNYVFSDSGHGFHDLSLDFRGGVMWFIGGL